MWRTLVDIAKWFSEVAIFHPPPAVFESSGCSASLPTLGVVCPFILAIVVVQMALVLLSSQGGEPPWQVGGCEIWGAWSTPTWLYLVPVSRVFRSWQMH